MSTGYIELHDYITRLLHDFIYLQVAEMIPNETLRINIDSLAVEKKKGVDPVT